MSKKLLLTLPMMLLLGGCTLFSSPTPSSPSLTGASEVPSTTTAVTGAVAPQLSLEDCTKAVQTHIADVQTRAVDATKKVESSKSIVVDYVGRLIDGTVFDTSVESVAKACGLYTAQRNYAEGLSFIAGTGQMIPGFDKAVIGMSVNETKTITIPARDAYGETIVSIPLNQLPAKPDGSAYKAGESIPTQNGAIVIESMTDKEFVIKNNHPLAGRELIFDITIKAVK